MHTHIRSLLALSAVALSISSAFAAPANPLVRPTALAARQQSAQAPQGMPPPPPAFNPGSSGDDKEAQKGFKAVQAQLARYSVVAISGDTAVLRALPGVQAAAGAGTPGMTDPNAMAGAAPVPGATGAPAANTQNQASVLPSLVVKHKQNIFVQDVEVVPEIANGQVSLRAAEGNRAVFYGRLDGMSTRVMTKGVKMEAVDAAYVQRQSPPINSQNSNGSTTNSASPSGAGFGSANGFGH